MITGTIMRNIQKMTEYEGADFAKRPYNLEQWAGKSLTHI